MSGRAKLLFVVNGFGVGGGELKLLELAARLDGKKYELAVVSVGQGGPLQESFQRLGIPVQVLAKKHRFDLSLPVRLAGVMRRQRTALVMSTLFYADVMTALATFLYRPRAVVSWEVITGRLKWYQQLAYRLLAGRFDQVAAVSNSIHPFIIHQRGVRPERIRTIYYGVDLEKFKPAPASKRNLSLVFGTVARLVEQKGHRYLLEAIAAVHGEMPQAKWRWAGEGDLQSELQNRAAQLGLADAVEFLGRRSDVVDLLCVFDVFILPSLWEGFPNVLLEAMACGLPVIATGVEGTVELVADQETGLIVEKENPSALAGAMRALATDRQRRLRMGAAGRRRVEEYFSLQKQIKEFESLFDQLLQGSSL